MWSYGHKCNEVKNLLHAIQLQGHSDDEEEAEVAEGCQQEQEIQEAPLGADDNPQDKLMSISEAA